MAEMAARLGADVTDPDLAAVYGAGMDDMRAYFMCDPWTAAHTEAMYRVTGNLWATRGATLGVIDTGSDFGATYIPRRPDPTVMRLMGPHLRRPFS